MFSLLEKLAASDKKARYDKQALAILSQKKLMAKLLKEVVPEVKQYSVEEIETFKLSKNKKSPTHQALSRCCPKTTTAIHSYNIPYEKKLCKRF